MEQTLINALFGVAATALGWIIKSIYDAMNRLKDDVKEIEKEIHRDYVRKDDFREDMKEVKEMLNAIFKRLENKADKWKSWDMRSPSGCASLLIDKLAGYSPVLAH